MDVAPVTYSALALSFLLPVIPLAIGLFLGLSFIRPLLFATVRMSVQLLLVSFFLQYLFTLNRPLLNIAWLVLMVMVAVMSAVQQSELNLKRFMLPTFSAFMLATFIVVLYLNIVVIRLDRVFDARYLVVLGGMVLGNSLRGTIVGLGTFYTNIRKDYAHYLYLLSLGARQHEALRAYVYESVYLSLKPTIAAMTTMGIVSLPGMMTGVILSGTDPVMAVRYQIMIMMGIVAATFLSVMLTIIITARMCFSPYGTLENDLFIKKP